LAINAQKMGILPVFIITEMKWSWEHAKQMGFQVEDVIDEETGEVVAPAKATKAAPKDLPWEDDEEEETPAPKANYALKTAPTKTSKAAKFDALFEDEE